LLVRLPPEGVPWKPVEHELLENVISYVGRTRRNKVYFDVRSLCATLILVGWTGPNEYLGRK
jgi:hypothetical protein